MHGRRPRRLSRSPVTLSQVDLIWTDQTAQLDDGDLLGPACDVRESTRYRSGSEEAVTRGP
jgi:hypothetical protein